MPSYGSWKPYTKHVQGGMREGNFANAQFALLCAGPPFFKQLTSAAVGATEAAHLAVYPIGITQNFSMQQSKSISRIFEIGSDRSYFIAGRSVGQLGLGRVYYNGPSLLRVLYAYYSTADVAIPGTHPIKSLFDTSKTTAPFGVPPFTPESSLVEPTGDTSKRLHAVRIPPGYDNFFINLASDLFSHPFGLMFVLKDNEENTLGAIYLEQCYSPSHSFGTDAQGTLIQESVSIQYERIVPIQIQQLKLVRDVGGIDPSGGGFLDDVYGDAYAPSSV